MRYRTIEETVTTLSADAVVTEKRPKNEARQTSVFFPAQLTLVEGEIDVDGQMIRLSSGMKMKVNKLVHIERRIHEPNKFDEMQPEVFVLDCE